MTIRNAILAALADSEFSGYDLAKSFHTTVSNFWTATPQQLYREMDKMEREGLINARRIEQERRPNKRVFTLTDAGREALYAFSTQDPRPTAMRDELLVQVEALESGDRDAIRASVEERLAGAQRKVALYEHRREAMMSGRGEAEYLAEEKRIGPYLTLMRGLGYEHEIISWCEFVLKVLDTRPTPQN